MKKIERQDKYRLPTAEETLAIVRELGQQYDDMESDIKTEIRDQLLKQFIRTHETDPAYQEDSARYIRMRFRPRLAYIRVISGTDMSDATLRRLLTQGKK